VSAGRAAAARVGLLVASLLFFLAVAEVGLRLTTSEPIRDAEGQGKTGFSLREIAEPNLDGTFLGLGYRTNSRGIRGPEFTPEPDADVFRILFTGDSVTMGWRVEEDEAYPKVVERMLNQAGVGPGRLRSEAINVGLAGLDIAGAMDRLESNASAYSPDLLVFGYTLNDIEGPAYRKKQSPKLAIELMQQHRRYADSPSRLVRFVWPRLSAFKERFFPTLVPYSETLHDNYFENPEAWRAVEVGLDRLAGLAAARSICAHLLVHSELANLDAAEHDYLDIYSLIETAAKERGISVSQSFPFFEGRDGEALKAAFLDNHPGAEGHELLAQALIDGLRVLPASCFAKGRGGENVGR